MCLTLKKFIKIALKFQVFPEETDTPPCTFMKIATMVSECWLQCEKSAVKSNHVYNLQQREESVFLGR